MLSQAIFEADLDLTNYNTVASPKQYQLIPVEEFGCVADSCKPGPTSVGEPDSTSMPTSMQPSTSSSPGNSSSQRKRTQSTLERQSSYRKTTKTSPTSSSRSCVKIDNGKLDRPTRKETGKLDKSPKKEIKHVGQVKKTKKETETTRHQIVSEKEKTISPRRSHPRQNSKQERAGSGSPKVIGKKDDTRSAKPNQKRQEEQQRTSNTTKPEQTRKRKILVSSSSSSSLSSSSSSSSSNSSSDEDGSDDAETDKHNTMIGKSNSINFCFFTISRIDKSNSDR